jgi:hypothetical protein
MGSKEAEVSIELLARSLRIRGTPNDQSITQHHSVKYLGRTAEANFQNIEIALILIARLGHLQCIEILLDHGADASLLNSSSEGPDSAYSRRSALHLPHVLATLRLFDYF